LTWRGLQRAALGDALDLRDDDAARVVRRHRDGQRLQRQRLALHGEVAVGSAVVPRMMPTWIGKAL
jgi:hypothetical protein